ncbi:MAG: hypothetical protein KGD64_12920 [Candidatus Heimdallarchaeota archaeon]|nr:hypothetical protein [Candidatus Heimdallarchaeota archaeon]
MKINKDKLEEVGDLVEVDPEVIEQQKRKKLRGYLIHYYVQVFLLLLSSLLGYLFVLWEHSDTSYPHSFTPRHVYLGPISLLILHGSNTVHSYFNKKKYHLRFVSVYPPVLVNLILSFVSFFLIYNVFYREPVYSPFGVTVEYGVFNERKIKKIIMQKICKGN